jgi:hypothetical protein
VKNGPYNLTDYSLKKLALDNMIVYTALYRKIDWRRIGGYDEKMEHRLEDWEFWINLLKDGGEVVQVNSIPFFTESRKALEMPILSKDKMQYDTYYNKKLVRLALKYTDTYHSIRKLMK